MKFKSLIVVAILILTIPVAAQEVSDPMRHGDCITGTMSDPMSDESGAFVVCGSEPTIFVIVREPGRSGMQMAIQTSLTKMVADNSSLTELSQLSKSEVKFRVDKGEILTGFGHLSKDGSLYIGDNSLAKEIMQKISNGQKLHFSIDGTHTETVLLRGAKEAVEDMKRRLESGEVSQ